ncbi:MAG: polysaccharide deacetylase [Rhizobacter sp.]|nr:polysaccharide deacetylase [Rhizobacter sp.]
MDHTLYDYSALPTRAPFQWGANQGLAAFAVLFLEHWELLPPHDSLRDPRLVGEFGSFSPDYRSWTQREYGLRIGIFRVIDALKEAGIRPVIAANAMAVRRLPKLVETFNEWGCEWLAHGIAATRMLNSAQPLDVQRSHIEESIAAITEASGQRPVGWVGQDWGSTPHSHSLLAEAGIRYTLDWVNDDQPYWMSTEPRLLSIPLSAEWDDVQCQWLRNIEPSVHAALALAAFERLRLECSQHGRAAAFGLSIHPWLSGMPSRIRALQTLLSQLRAAPDVLWTSPGDLLQIMPRSQ